MLLVVSALYEYSFIHLGLNLLDEGWPLYAAKRMHEGGQLYRDAFFVFPPGHVLTAWLGYGWQPPGIIPTRFLDAGFNVSLVAALYLVGRRLMPASFAFLAALLLAVATPYSHVAHFLFGYRYLVFSTLGLLAFFQRVTSGNPRWLVVSGLCAGVAVCFRLTPAFSLSLAVAVAVVANDRDWRVWLRDWSLYAAGVLTVLVPVIAWLGLTVGLDVAWREIIVRPIVMTRLQSLPIAPLDPPRFWNRTSISRYWTAVQFRLWMALYAGYLIGVAWAWWKALRRREPFEHVLLLAAVIWGATFFVRTLGRSDVAHLESALPPVCLFLAHALWLALRPLLRRPRFDAWDRRLLIGGMGTVVFAGWIYLFGTDMHVKILGQSHYFEEIDGIAMKDEIAVRVIDKRIRTMRRDSKPGQAILDLSYAPLFYVIVDRNGPGWFDLIMPGTFLDRKEEIFFIRKLAKADPAFIVVLDRHFDGMPSRSLRNIAPLVVRWIKRRYEARETLPDYNFLYPRGSQPPAEDEEPPDDAG